MNIANKTYCNMIHGGLWLNFIDYAYQNKIGYKFCCSTTGLEQTCDFDVEDFWENEYFSHYRKNNLTGSWEDICVSSCKTMEDANQDSFRTTYNRTFGENNFYSGPLRLDIKLDNACNLACRSCNDNFSTLWYKQLKENNLPTRFTKGQFDTNSVYRFLDRLDLSQLEVIVICGGETLLSRHNYNFLEYIKKRRPDQNILISFQTNGTILPTEKQFDLLNSFKMVRFQISIDGTKDRFNYLRWPADWNETTENILKLREIAGVNTMFLVEETLSIFNYLYKNECRDWVTENFPTNRLGDKVDYSCHFATGIFSLNNMSDEYIDALDNESIKRYYRKNKNDDAAIRHMIGTINQFDKIRNQDWERIFPEVYSFYRSYVDR